MSTFNNKWQVQYSTSKHTYENCIFVVLNKTQNKLCRPQIELEKLHKIKSADVQE